MARTSLMAVAFVLAAVVVQEASSEALDGTGIRGKDGALLSNPSAMLAELERMVHSVEVPAFDVISRFKAFIEEQIQPGLGDMRKLALEDTADYLAAIQLCNDESITKEGAIEAGIQVTVNDARVHHASCRDLEKIMHNHNLTNADSYCRKLGEFLRDAAELTVRIPRNATTRDAKVQYVEQASDTNMCRRSEVRGLADSCAAKEAELNNKSNDCSTKQQSFEVAFCTWKAELESNCEDLDTCHSASVTAFEKHVAKTQPLVEKWDAEAATLHKVLCYCNTWLRETDAGDNRSQHNATQFEACKDSIHAAVPVSYGTPPEKVACLLTSVANYPGASGFITQEYGLFLDFIQTVVPCPQATTVDATTALPATPQAPTTEVPTTTAPTTEAPDVFNVQYDIIIDSVDYDRLNSNPAVKEQFISEIKTVLLSSLPDGYTADDITVTFSQATPINATVLMDIGRAAGVAMDTARAKNGNTPVKARIDIEHNANVPLDQLKNWTLLLEKGSDDLDAQITTRIQSIADLGKVIQVDRTKDNVIVSGKMPIMEAPTTGAPTTEATTTEAPKPNCTDTVCAQDLCWNDEPRRQIGDDCCACPPKPNCTDTVCAQDLCWDDEPRRQIGDDCCACPPRDCSKQVCTEDLCWDGGARRQIGDDCCACPPQNCSKQVCTKDVCWDGGDRRQIGDDCCACPPKDCSKQACTNDLCWDGEGRRQIGDDCCACPPKNCSKQVCTKDVCWDGGGEATRGGRQGPQGSQDK